MAIIEPVDERIVATSVQTALEEDLGSGDITAQLIDAEAEGQATLITRESMCLCGTAWFNAVFTQIDARAQIHWHYRDGDAVAADATLCTLSGPARALLTGERTAMNFVQMLSATATLTRNYVQWLAGTSTQLLDTRKTIPGHRLAQKYAVRCGGGTNHRIGLYDAFLIKENHIAAAGGIAQAIMRAHQIAPAKPVEVEVETLGQLEEAIQHGADIVMLDNFDDAAVEQAVRLNHKRAKIEISGNVDEARVKRLAKSGVDYISVGSLTKHVHAIDLSMRFTGAVKSEFIKAALVNKN